MEDNSFEAIVHKIKEFVKKVDFYRVMPKGLTEPSVHGASSNIHYSFTNMLKRVVSMAATCLLLLLLTSQLAKYLSIKLESDIVLFDPTVPHSNSVIIILNFISKIINVTFLFRLMLCLILTLMRYPAKFCPSICLTLWAPQR